MVPLQANNQNPSVSAIVTRNTKTVWPELLSKVRNIDVSLTNKVLDQNS